MFALFNRAAATPSWGQLQVSIMYFLHFHLNNFSTVHRVVINLCKTIQLNLNFGW